MSARNVEIVRAVFAAYNRGDLQTTLDHLAPEFVFEPSGLFMDTRPAYRGKEEWTEFWHAFRAAWEDIAIEVERVEDLGNQVLVLGRFHGRGRGSGVEVARESAWIQRLSDGLIVHTRTFADWAEALRQSGLEQ
jgi:ketosteroid isomerase-like protein